MYALNIIIPFFLITLFNIQAQIEYPYDQDGMDDIKLDAYRMDYVIGDDEMEVSESLI